MNITAYDTGVEKARGNTEDFKKYIKSSERRCFENIYSRIIYPSSLVDRQRRIKFQKEPVELATV